MISKKNYKHYKLIYNLSLMNNKLNSKNFFIFYYNIFNKKQKNLIKQTLNNENFEIITIKKNVVLKNFQNKNNLINLNNFLTNNTIILTFDNDNNFFNNNIFDNLKNLKFLTLIGF